MIKYLSENDVISAGRFFTVLDISTGEKLYHGTCREMALNVFHEDGKNGLNVEFNGFNECMTYTNGILCNWSNLGLVQQ